MRDILCSTHLPDVHANEMITSCFMNDSLFDVIRWIASSGVEDKMCRKNVRVGFRVDFKVGLRWFRVGLE